MGVGPCSGVILTCQMSAYIFRFPSRTTSTCLCNVIVVEVNVLLHPSEHSFHMEIIAPDWRWGKFWDISPLVDSKGLMLSSALWVACIMLPSGRMTHSTYAVLALLLQGVYTLM